MRFAGLVTLALVMSGCTIHVVNEPTSPTAVASPVAVAAPGAYYGSPATRAPAAPTRHRPVAAQRPRTVRHEPQLSADKPAPAPSAVARSPFPTTPFRTAPRSDVAQAAPEPRDSRWLRRFKDTEPQARNAQKPG